MASSGSSSEKMNVGDKIEFNRGLYNHVAVYFGKEKGQDMVVHVTGEPGVDSKKPGACSVLKQPFSMVKGTSSHKVNNELDQTYSAKNQSKIIEYLEKSIGKKWKYNLADNNCEHFANLARYNQHFSAQGQKLYDYCKEQGSFESFYRDFP
ncbi:phospholipase A and acyltransferase 2-like [Erpetoichthys calabaricus]|uniref:phospholipase A and acyltransferase 2-like n=1 Tax=Erpetoichthys calabaricus TaxID=27687 RepID=UPI00109FC69C|nr:phospholipase A and acyltransferase 2-like [Erpetoichthys calabaricus]